MTPTVGIARGDFTPPPDAPVTDGTFVLGLVVAWLALCWLRASFRLILGRLS